jgi:RimJ/RimL family protein N-acetyltransferase
MTKRDIGRIEDARIILRLIQKSDLPLTLSWRNSDDIRQWFLTTDVIRAERHREWYQRYEGLDNDFVFIILSKEMGLQPVGQISLYAIDWIRSIGEYGRLMIGDKQARGKGYAKSASLLLFKISFEIFGLKQILLEVKQDNHAAISLYHSLGFFETDINNGLVRMSKLPNP